MSGLLRSLGVALGLLILGSLLVGLLGVTLVLGVLLVLLGLLARVERTGVVLPRLLGALLHRGQTLRSLLGEHGCQEGLVGVHLIGLHVPLLGEHRLEERLGVIVTTRAGRREGHVLDGEKVRPTVTLLSVATQARLDLTLREGHEVDGLILDGLGAGVLAQHPRRETDALRGLRLQRSAKLAAGLLRRPVGEVVREVGGRVTLRAVRARKGRRGTVRVRPGVRILGPGRRVTVLVGVSLRVGVRGRVDGGLLVAGGGRGSGCLAGEVLCETATRHCGFSCAISSA